MRARLTLLIGLAVALAAGFALSTWAPGAFSYPNLFTDRCASCHNNDNPTCNGCHHHRGTLNATTDRTSYNPGDPVTVTLAGGTRSGWIRALLYNESDVEIDRKTGPTGMGDDMQPNPVVFPVVLHGTAPAQPGTYTWNAAWFGNLNDGGDQHGENRRSFQVTVVQPTGIPDQGAPIFQSTWGLIKAVFD